MRHKTLPLLRPCNHNKMIFRVCDSDKTRTHNAHKLRNGKGISINYIKILLCSFKVYSTTSNSKTQSIKCELRFVVKEGFLREQEMSTGRRTKREQKHVPLQRDQFPC